jgi:hypothetical protein
MLYPALFHLAQSVQAAAPPGDSPNFAWPDVTKNLGLLLVAAAFGLSPAALIGRLQQTTDKYKEQLSSADNGD